MNEDDDEDDEIQYKYLQTKKRCRRIVRQQRAGEDGVDFVMHVRCAFCMQYWRTIYADDHDDCHKRGYSICAHD